MTITVVIASYKYGHLAAHAIESVLAQTKKADSILFVDDAAGDCTHLPLLYPELDYTLRIKNLGVVANFNDMLQKVHTDRVVFLGADNWLRQDALERLSYSLADVTSYDVAIVGEKKDGLIGAVGGEIWKGVLHGSSMYNVQMAKDQGGYERAQGTEHTEEDRMLFTKMLNAGGSRAHLDQPLLFYRRHRSNGNTP